MSKCDRSPQDPSRSPSQAHTRIIMVLTCLTTSVLAIDNYHFYRPPFRTDEPRFEQPWLTSIDVQLGGGSTDEARDPCGDETCLLNLHGAHAMHKLGTGVPGLDPANNLDKILLDLAAVPDRAGFGDLTFHGDFTIREYVINVHQNFNHGFFGQMYLPIRSLEIKRVGFVDQSPENSAMPNQQTAEWQQFLDNFSAILARHGLFMCPVDESGVGDISFLLGWTINKQDTEVFDFLDATIKIGLLISTSDKTPLNNPFNLPLGYNGHTGVPLSFAGAAGLFEWLTLGVHVEGLFLTKETQEVRIKTAPEQNGFIKLARTTAEVDPGSIWHFGTFLKVDHILRRLSIVLGYSYTKQDPTRLCPCTPGAFDAELANTDATLQKWHQHTIHLLGEYDFAHEGNTFHPRLRLLVNTIVRGKRIFDLSVGGIGLGLEVTWHH